MAADLPECYHGPMSKKECEDLLGAKNKDGAYLIRESESIQGALCLCIYKQKVVYTYRILQGHNGHYTLLTAGGLPETYFKTLGDLIRNYKRKNQGLTVHLRHAVKKKTPRLIQPPSRPRAPTIQPETSPEVPSAASSRASSAASSRASPGASSRASSAASSRALPGAPSRASSAASSRASPGPPSRASPGPPSRASPGPPSRASPGPPSRASPGPPSRALPGAPSRASPGAPSRASPGASSRVPSVASPGHTLQRKRFPLPDEGHDEDNEYENGPFAEYVEVLPDPL